MNHCLDFNGTFTNYLLALQLQLLKVYLEKKNSFFVTVRTHGEDYNFRFCMLGKAKDMMTQVGCNIISYQLYKSCTVGC